METAQAAQRTDVADFSYVEKDLIAKVGKGLNAQLCGLTLVKQPRESVHVKLVQVYGEAFQSKHKAPKHGGAQHQAIVFNLQMDVMWYGRVMLGETTLGSASGKVKIGEIDLENYADPSKWETSVRLEVEPSPATVASLGPNYKEVEPSKVEGQLKQLVLEQGVPVLLPEVQKAVEKLLIKGNFDVDIDERVEEQRPVAPEESTVDCSDLRRQLLGANYLKIIDGEETNLESWELRICTIADKDMAPLCEKLAEHPNLNKIDMYFNYIHDSGLKQLVEGIKDLKRLEVLDLRNNKIGDEGVQVLTAMLACGGAPSLTTIKLQANPDISSVGHTVSSALKLLRSEVCIEFDPLE